ncbi:MAG: hypothetical protein GX327_06125 [Epulopiscium sp.]|nr:hypothetical protein [Candidatus Epulonipiscium sp.]
MKDIKWNKVFSDFFNKYIEYLRMPLEEQAQYLENKKKYRLARRKYIRLKNYKKVIELSRLIADYKSLFIYQVKDNQIYEAMQTAELYELYKLGAPLCEKQGAIIKAAHMYSKFDYIKAASLYKQEKIWDKAADCYLKSNQWIRAIDCLEEIKSIEKYKEIYEKIEKIGEKLIEKQNYVEAIKLYVRINSLEKALELTKKINDKKTALMLYEKLAEDALNNKDFTKASLYFEMYDSSKAFKLYLQNNDISNAARLLLEQEKWEEAIHLFLKNEMEDKAIEIAQEKNNYQILLDYYKSNKNYDKVSWIYDVSHKAEEAIEYFKSENQTDYLIYFAKQLTAAKTAEILKEIGNYEQAAHYYLLDDNKEECTNCLKLAGKSPKEIQDYLFIKNYPA